MTFLAEIELYNTVYQIWSRKLVQKDIEVFSNFRILVDNFVSPFGSDFLYSTIYI